MLRHHTYLSAGFNGVGSRVVPYSDTPMLPTESMTATVDNPTDEGAGNAASVTATGDLNPPMTPK